jgi:hypothetical protein
MRTEDQVCLVLVVTPTPERDVLDGGRSSLREGVYVMELQERPLGASPSVLGDEGALAAVTLVDSALDGPRDVPRS